MQKIRSKVFKIRRWAPDSLDHKFIPVDQNDNESNACEIDYFVQNTERNSILEDEPEKVSQTIQLP